MSSTLPRGEREAVSAAIAGRGWLRRRRYRPIERHVVIAEIYSSNAPARMKLTKRMTESGAWPVMLNAWRYCPKSYSRLIGAAESQALSSGKGSRRGSCSCFGRRNPGPIANICRHVSAYQTEAMYHRPHLSWPAITAYPTYQAVAC